MSCSKAARPVYLDGKGCRTVPILICKQKFIQVYWALHSHGCIKISKRGCLIVDMPDELVGYFERVYHVHRQTSKSGNYYPVGVHCTLINLHTLAWIYFSNRHPQENTVCCHGCSDSSCLQHVQEGSEELNKEHKKCYWEVTQFSEWKIKKLECSHVIMCYPPLKGQHIEVIMADEPSFEILQNEVVYTKPDGTVIRTEAVGNHFTIKETPEGREMICSIDAKAGDLIFCEQAYAITPETSLLTSKKLCLMCCKALRIKDATSSVNDLAPVAVHCPSCNLAFCSTECAKNIIHELECGLIPKVCEAVIEADSKGHKLELSPMLLIIRILLKGLLDKGFTLIEGMLSHVQEHSPSWRKKYEIFAEAFCRDLPANEDGSKLFSEARIVEMACLLDTNAFGGVNQVTSQQLSTGLFYYSALLNNSCDPNVIYSVLDDKITMRAIKEIPKGTPLRDTYVDLLFPTRERQATLLKSKAFFCTCERCKDPSEQGRYLSAWKCGKEGCDGYMLPTVSFAKETKQITQTWACEKCGTTNKDDEGVPGQIQKLREFLAQRTWNADPASFVRIAEQQCSPLLPSLHSNHHLRVFYALEMANALRAQKKYDEAVVFMGQVCGIVTKIAPNTTQETDCLCQLGQLYAHLFIEASEAEKANPSTTTQKAKTEFAQLYRKATADSLRVARICLGEYHPHTIALSKTFAT